MDSALKVQFILTDVLVAIYLPLVIYFAYDYSKYLHHVVLLKRYCSITMIECVCIIIKLSAEFISNTAELTQSIKPHGFWYELIIFISKISFIIWEWLITYRCWLIYYDICWSSLIISNEWKYILNSKYLETNKHKFSNKFNRFIIKNKHKYGNYKFCGKYILSVIIVINTIYEFIPVLITILYPGSNNLHYVLKAELSTLPLAIIPYICLVVIYLIFRKTLFNDLFYITSELKKIFVTLLCCIISFWSYFVYAVSFQQDHLKQHLQVLSRNLSLFLIFLTVSFATFYVTTKLKNIIKKQKISMTSNRYINLSVITDSKQQQKNNNNMKTLKLLDIFKNEKYFTLFMNHLALELSSECMLAFIEIVCFQQYLYRVYINNINQERIIKDDPFKMTLFRNVEFCHCIPKSLIVYNMENNDNMKQYKLGAYKIYQKYVEVGCKLEINIPFNVRFNCDKNLKNFQQWMNERNIVDTKQLILIFDECINRVYRLMDAAFVRFKTGLVDQT